MKNLSKWSDAKLDRELAFAEMALDADYPETVAWLAAIRAEVRRRLEKKAA